MSGFLVSMQGAISQGVIWGIMALGVYITFRIMDIADLTVDGSFALGGCTCAVLMAQYGMNPILALLISTLAGFLAGAVTGFLHTVFEIPAILAGILTQYSLWSINLRVMGQKSNIPLLNVDSIFTWMTEATGLRSTVVLIIGAVVVALLIWALYWFFGTEMGAALRATGNNEAMIRALGVNVKVMKVLALAISNALVGLSGALYCQSSKVGDIQMGTGTIVIGLAAIVIGEVLVGRKRAFGTKLLSAVLGSIVFFIIRAVVMWFKIMEANDTKLVSAIIVVLALCAPVLSARWKQRKSYAKGDE